jgi:hypothetical protein
MSREFGGGFHWPTVVNSYAVSSIVVFAPTPLGLTDTESDLVIDQQMDPTTPWTLPGLPFNVVSTPLQRLLKVTSSAAGTPVYVSPADFAAQFPALADFRQLVMSEVNDFARVQWNGSLWQLIDKSVTTLVVPIDQFNVTIPNQ